MLPGNVTQTEKYTSFGMIKAFAILLNQQLWCPGIMWFMWMWSVVVFTCGSEHPWPTQQLQIIFIHSSLLVNSFTGLLTTKTNHNNDGSFQYFVLRYCNVATYMQHLHFFWWIGECGMSLVSLTVFSDCLSMSLFILIFQM